MDRRQWLKGSLAAGGLAAFGARPARAADPSLPIWPVRAHRDRIYDIKSCIRPFRPQGPRLDTETVGDALIVHNYGHGGSGWSLSWGSAQIAVEKAMATLPAQVAVVGCGIVGLTSAITAQRAGAKVTIYARDPYIRTRTMRAGGLWTPDSRISLKDPAGPAFGALWETMARTSYKTFRSHMGLPGRPIDFSDSYVLRDTAEVPDIHAYNPAITDTYATKGLPQQNSEFGLYGDRIRDLVDQPEELPTAEIPFPAPYAQRSSVMFFNFASYGDLLMQQFYAAGGTLVIREFHSPAELGGLGEKVVINCPGYAARQLWNDTSLIPVRGQTAWLIPQPEVTYGLRYRGAIMHSKSDGILVMGGRAMAGGDMANIGNSNEVPDRAEAEEAVGVLEELFSRFVPKVKA